MLSIPYGIINLGYIASLRTLSLGITKRKGYNRKDKKIAKKNEYHKKEIYGRVAEWLKATDCKFVEVILRRFESYLSQQIFSTTFIIL